MDDEDAFWGEPISAACVVAPAPALATFIAAPSSVVPTPPSEEDQGKKKRKGLLSLGNSLPPSQKAPSQEFVVGGIKQIQQNPSSNNDFETPSTISYADQQKPLAAGKRTLSSAVEVPSPVRSELSKNKKRRQIPMEDDDEQNTTLAQLQEDSAKDSDDESGVRDICEVLEEEEKQRIPDPPVKKGNTENVSASIAKISPVQQKQGKEKTQILSDEDSDDDFAMGSKTKKSRPARKKNNKKIEDDEDDLVVLDSQAVCIKAERDKRVEMHPEVMKKTEKKKKKAELKKEATKETGKKRGRPKKKTAEEEEVNRDDPAMAAPRAGSVSPTVSVALVCDTETPGPCKEDEVEAAEDKDEGLEEVEGEKEEVEGEKEEEEGDWAPQELAQPKTKRKRNASEGDDAEAKAAALEAKQKNEALVQGRASRAARRSTLKPVVLGTEPIVLKAIPVQRVYQGEVNTNFASPPPRTGLRPVSGGLATKGPSVRLMPSVGGPMSVKAGLSRFRGNFNAPRPIAQSQK